MTVARRFATPQDFSAAAIQREREELVSFERRKKDMIAADHRRRMAGGQRGLPHNVLVWSDAIRQRRGFRDSGAVRSPEARPIRGGRLHGKSKGCQYERYRRSPHRFSHHTSERRHHPGPARYDNVLAQRLDAPESTFKVTPRSTESGAIFRTALAKEQRRRARSRLAGISSLNRVARRSHAAMQISRGHCHRLERRTR